MQRTQVMNKMILIVTIDGGEIIDRSFRPASRIYVVDLLQVRKLLLRVRSAVAPAVWIRASKC